MLVDQKGGDRRLEKPFTSAVDVDPKHPANILGGDPDFNTFFRIHENVMWKLSAVDFSQIDRTKLNQRDIDGVKGAMLVESHNPVYTQRILEYFRRDRVMTGFVVTWAYEEMKHHQVLERYLRACNMVDEPALDDLLTQTRDGAWGDEEQGFKRVQNLTYTIVQEQVTGRFYKRFAEVTEEPLLQQILSIISKDEYRHCAYYLLKGKQELATGNGTFSDVREALLRFRMPGEDFIPDYEQNVLIPGLKIAPVDGSALMETMDMVRQLVGPLNFIRLATDRAFYRKMSDEYDVDLGSILKS